MKKNGFLLGTFVFLLTALTACGSETAGSEGTEEAVQEEDLSVLGIILEDMELSGPDILQEEIVLSDLGVWPEEVVFSDLEQMQEDVPESGSEEVAIFYGNSASDWLNSETALLEQLTAENLIDELFGHNIVSLDTKVNTFEERETDEGRVLHLDLSHGFREYLKTMTKEGENVIMASVAATFLEAYKADGIVITVDGNVLETRHALYEEPFRAGTERLLAPQKEKGKE